MATGPPPDSSDGDDASTDKRPIVEDPNTSICQVAFDADGPVGIGSAGSAMRRKGDGEDGHASDANTLRPPPPEDSDEPFVPEPVQEVMLAEQVSTVSKIRDLSRSSSSTEVPAFHHVEFQEGRPVHLNAVADPGRPRKSDAPASSSRPPPMALAPVSASQLVNLNSVVIDDPHRHAPSNRPPSTRTTVRRQVTLALGMFLLGVGTTLLLVLLLR